MDIADWRKRIDEIDLKLVELIGERARAAREIGKLKQNTNLPIYEPDREKEVFDNVASANKGPLPNPDLLRIFERLMDVMRKFQRDDASSPVGRDTELEAETND